MDTRKQGQSALLLPAPWVHMAEQPRVLPVELRDDLAHGLGSASRSRDDILGSPSAVTPHLPGGAIHRLLGGSDGVDGGHKSLHDAKVVMDDLGQGGQAVGGAGGIAGKEGGKSGARPLGTRGHYQPASPPPLCCAHLTILRVLLYFSWFTPITNMGASAEGAEMMTLLAPPFK